MSNSEIVKNILADESYKEYVEEHLERYLDSNPELAESWADWFEGKPVEWS